MSPFQRPGWSLPNGHIVRSQPEAAVCEYLTAAKEPHDHSTLVFELALPGERTVLYRPDIVLTQTEIDGRVILIDPITSPYPGSGLRRLIAFREWHADRYFVILLARRPLHPNIPREAYDLLLPIEDFEMLDRFLLTATGPS